MEFWQPYVISLMIGLLAGIEREKSRQEPKSMGIRTFLLVSLLGAVAGSLEAPAMALAIAVFALALIAISYFNQTRSHLRQQDIGLTTEFAAALVFFLAYMSHTAPTLSAVSGPIVAVILFLKSPLHRFTHAIKPAELQAALFLFLSAVVVVNLLPDESIDAWDVFNPRKFGYLVLILASLEFLSYVLVKVIGPSKGLLVSGFLGGFVSSTAVLMSSAKQAARHPSHSRGYYASALVANLSAMILLLLIVRLVSVELFTQILYPVASALAIGIAFIAVLGRGIQPLDSEFTVKSPLDWRGVIRLALVLAGILALITVTKRWLGENASMAVSFITGLFELHGVTLANATMFKQSQIGLKPAALNISLALIASFMSKMALAWIIERGKFAKSMTAIHVLQAAAIGLAAWLMA